MASTKLSRFAERVLSSTRISDNGQLPDDDADRLQSPKQDRLTHAHHPRRRLHLLDDDDDADDPSGVNTKENDENLDPSFMSNALPSSIPFPASSRLSSDEDGYDDMAVGMKRGQSHIAQIDEDDVDEDEDEDETQIAPLSRRLLAQYDSRISMTERDRLAADRSPSMQSIRSEPEEDDEARRSDDEQPVVADTQNEDVDVQALDRLRRLSKGAAKHTVKKPRPKLDPECLLSDRGLPKLLEDFKRVQFQGRGYEFKDLDRLLFTYEAWANRLLAKSPFVEIIERLERVGSKREIQVALHRLRTGVWPPNLSEEYVHDTDSDDGDYRGHERTVTAEHPDLEDEDVAWERALRAMPVQSNEEKQKMLPKPSGQTQSSNLPADDSFSDLDDGTSAVRSNQSTSVPITVPGPPSPSVPGPSTSSLWTEEARIERNRRLALERLEAKRRSASGFGFKLSQTQSPKTAGGSPSILKSALKAALTTPTSSTQPGSPSTVLTGDQQLGGFPVNWSATCPAPSTVSDHSELSD